MIIYDVIETGSNKFKVVKLEVKERKCTYKIEKGSLKAYGYKNIIKKEEAFLSPVVAIRAKISKKLKERLPLIAQLKELEKDISILNLLRNELLLKGE